MTSKLFAPKQLKVIQFDNEFNPRITILEGAVRSGKTRIGEFLWVKHIHKFKGQNRKFIMTGITIPALKRNVLDDISEIFGFDTLLNKNNEFKLFGNTVACFGTDKIDSYKSMKGFTSWGWYGNEITESHKNSIDQAFKRCSGEGARIFWDTNPASPNHFIKENYIDKDDELLNDGSYHIKSWHFVLDDNTFLSETYKESLKKATPSGMWYDRDINGLWVAAEGMIYRDFDYDKHTISQKDLPIIKDYWYGVDWGFEHKGVLAVYGQDHDGKCFRIKEIVETQRGVDWWVERGLEIKKEFGDSRFYCDDARPDNISAFRKAGLRAKGSSKAVVEGISFVASLFRGDRLVIVRETNKNYLQEIYNYRWKENSVKEEPVKENDDSMDSERYALYTHLRKGSSLEILK